MLIADLRVRLSRCCTPSSTARFWTCYVSDGLSRVYNVIAHARNTEAGGLDRVTVLNCWATDSNFPCPTGRKQIVAAAAASPPSVEGEDLALVQRQLLALKTADGPRIRQAACRPLGSSWFTGSGSWIYGTAWTCYVADGISRVYNVNVHLHNSKTGGIDKLTVLNCWPTWARFTCPRVRRRSSCLPRSESRRSVPTPLAVPRPSPRLSGAVDESRPQGLELTAPDSSLKPPSWSAPPGVMAARPGEYEKGAGCPVHGPV